jgi:glutamate synthase (NADPH) large chain
VRAGKVILVLSDRNIAKDRLPIHALFATGAVHHALIDAGLRCDANIVVETGTARDPHQIACLIGYGATAVYPYLAYQASANSSDRRDQAQPRQGAVQLPQGHRQGPLQGHVQDGHFAIASYRGAQLFEIVGLHDERGRPVPEGHGVAHFRRQLRRLRADQKLLRKTAFNPLQADRPAAC